MTSRSPELELTSYLSHAEQLYGVVLSLAPTFNSTEVAALPDDMKPLVAQCIGGLLGFIDKIDGILRRFTFEGEPKDVSRRAFKVFRDEIRPKREEVFRLALALSGVPLDTETEERGDIWILLTQGVDTWNEDDDQFSAGVVEKAQALVDSPFFRPDEWVKNADDIMPAAFGPNAEQRIPSHVSLRLREILHSFILGNHLAAIALARAVLEYTLNDRATLIGVDVRHPTHRDRHKNLQWLAEDVAERRPHLKVPMETIIESANRTLHQKKNEKIFLTAYFLRNAALESARAIRTVVEELYF